MALPVVEPVTVDVARTWLFDHAGGLSSDRLSPVLHPHLVLDNQLPGMLFLTDQRAVLLGLRTLDFENGHVELTCVWTPAGEVVLHDAVRSLVARVFASTPLDKVYWKTWVDVADDRAGDATGTSSLVEARIPDMCWVDGRLAPLLTITWSRGAPSGTEFVA